MIGKNDTGRKTLVNIYKLIKKLVWVFLIVGIISWFKANKDGINETWSKIDKSIGIPTTEEFVLHPGGVGRLIKIASEEQVRIKANGYYEAQYISLDGTICMIKNRSYDDGWTPVNGKELEAAVINGYCGPLSAINVRVPNALHVWNEAREYFEIEELPPTLFRLKRWNET